MKDILFQEQNVGCQAEKKKRRDETSSIRTTRRIGASILYALALFPFVLLTLYKTAEMPVRQLHSVRRTRMSYSDVPLNHRRMNVTCSNCSEASSNGTDATCSWLAQYRSRHSDLIQRWKLNGFFDDDDFLDINCWWLQFEPAPLANHLILICIFIIILLVGCFCNALTLYILARQVTNVSHCRRLLIG